MLISVLLRVQKKDHVRGELFSTKTSNIESIEFQTKITLLFLFIMKDHYMLSI